MSAPHQLSLSWQPPLLRAIFIQHYFLLNKVSPRDADILYRSIILITLAIFSYKIFWNKTCSGYYLCATSFPELYNSTLTGWKLTTRISHDFGWGGSLPEASFTVGNQLRGINLQLTSPRSYENASYLKDIGLDLDLAQEHLLSLLYFFSKSFCFSPVLVPPL